MRKKMLLSLAMAGMLAIPAGAGAASNSELQAQIEKLTRDFNEKIEALQAQMADMQDENEEVIEEFEERAEKWDLASRFQLSGDFRARADYVTTDTPAFFSAFDVAEGVEEFFRLGDRLAAGGAKAAAAQAEAGALFGAAGFSQAQVNGIFPTLGPILSSRANAAQLADFMRTLTPQQLTAVFAAMNFNPVPQGDFDNDTMATNRLRLNLRVKALENVEFKGRLAMYKAWGSQNNPLEQTPFGPHQLSAMAFDGTSTRQPGDNTLLVDRAYVNWNNIGGLPVWFSVGRRPTTDGPPEHLRLGLDKRQATPVAFMNFAFDGFTAGYAYQDLFGLTGGPGRVRFCAGRGYESGLDHNGHDLDDTDFAGINWDIYKKGDRFINFQSFGSFNLMNVPENIAFPNPLEAAQVADAIEQLRDLADINAGFSDGFLDNGTANGILDRENLGNLWNTAFVYMDKVQKLNYFLSMGWTHTDPKGMDELGNSLLGQFWEDPESRDGYAVYVGGRYDLDDYGLKLGLEYNYGSQYWIGLTPSHDDLYSSKLATRGHVGEAYVIWDIPGGDAISKYADAFIRLGYQHYEYEYTGSGFWLGRPIDIDELTANPLNAQFFAPIDSQDQVYLTMEAYF